MGSELRGLGSLIICTRNRPESLERCLLSVLRVGEIPDEVIVVDSSSGSASRDVVQRLSGRTTTDLRWISASPGLTSQRNRGVREAAESSAIVHFIDDDTVVLPGYFRELIEVFAALPGCVGSGGRIVNAPVPRVSLGNRRLQSEGRVFRSGSNRLSTSVGNGSPRSVDWLSGCAMSFRRDLFDWVQFDERRTGNGMGEDVDFCLRALAFGSLQWVPAANIEHHQSPINRDGAFRLGRQVALHRLALAADGVHGIVAWRVRTGLFLEGARRILGGVFVRSLFSLRYGAGLLRELFS